MIRRVLSLAALSFASVSFINDLIYNNQHKTFIMTNCNSQKFPSTCQESTIIKTFHNTGEVIRYQEIDPISTSLLDGVVLRQENGKYYKAIYTENTINVEWYRCTYPTDLTNGTGDKVMLTKAINTAGYLGATLRFDAKEYILNEQLSFVNISCFKLLGDKQHTVIKSNTNERFESFYFSFTTCQNIIIEGLKFDLNKRNLLAYNSADDAVQKEFNGGVFFTDSSNIEITNCSFFDLYNRAIRIYSCHEGHIIVNNNLFESGLQNQIYVMEHLVISQSHNANVVVENNSFKNAENHDSSKAPCGIFGFDLGLFGSVLINNNYFEYCGRDNTGHHRLYAIDFYDNVNNFVISNNTFRNTTWGAIRFDGIRKNGIITDNIIHQLISDDGGMINASSRGAVEFNQTEFRNVIISNNILESSGETSYGIILQGLSSFCNTENIEISNNKFYNLKSCITLHGDMDTVSISNNQAFNLTAIGIYIQGRKVINGVEMEPRKMAKIYINDNNFSGHSNPDFKGIVGVQIDGKNGQHSFMGRILINNNFITNNNYGYGIIANTGDSLDNVITVTGNVIENVGTGLYIRTKKVFVKDNLIYNASIGAINDTDVPGQTIYHENFYNNVII
ncbi:right-handed parallel beta-helix repeat-containing protein [Chryseobacterium sp. JM1]|uniref:right-handed parallel beta-helix repeat-containing protein n=1 Tax=Chryseobacterium sp. JM1 TaxID=1233950 RepID=UPI0004E6C87B|nr:right-handed parallel beta-helix repeat-containing protein [Chryseobacterium sp. JM1]KFF21172.1 hypothetical protein IW22_09230 [Chryseobacterium sp. JM1]